jgi:hypothetical protein
VDRTISLLFRVAELLDGVLDFSMLQQEVGTVGMISTSSLTQMLAGFFLRPLFFSGLPEE